MKRWAGSALVEIYLSGSRAKGTAITLSSDFDLFISLKVDDTVTDEIVLLKVWRKLHRLIFPSIYLELTVIDTLWGISKASITILTRKKAWVWLCRSRSFKD
ncbi:nucleotidyltransferase domain-containing protein [Paenibacillus albus]|uniref:nucleotidyltransferase domain-containing protein n=1 Tax=Paenibacillus albus TaxID=2495582 RepID=UPI001D1307A4